MMLNRRRSGTAKTGYYRIQGNGGQFLHGFGDGDFIRLRDEKGCEWRGTAEVTDTTIRYRFQDQEGNYISGVSDEASSGILLRDDKGNTWRGFVD